MRGIEVEYAVMENDVVVPVAHPYACVSEEFIRLPARRGGEQWDTQAVALLCDGRDAKDKGQQAEIQFFHDGCVYMGMIYPFGR